MKLKVRYDIWIHLVVIFEGWWLFSCIFVYFYHVGFSMGQHTHIRFGGKHISTPPGPASLDACHSWFESLWETQTRRADGGLGLVGRWFLGWFLRWDESDTATGVLRGEIGKPLVAVVGWFGDPIVGSWESKYWDFDMLSWLTRPGPNI